MRRRVVGTLALCFVAACAASAIAQNQPVMNWDPAVLSQPQFTVRMEHNVKVIMRDGTYLSTDLYLPDAPGRFPVIFSRTPYSNNGGDAVASGRWWAERGYAYVTQDVRGKYDSGGEYALFRHEMNDGYDTMEWIGAQPWSNGNVGMVGGSYGGYVQIAQGILGSRYMKALAPSVTTSDIFNNWVYVDGALFLSFALGWGAVDMDGHVMQHGPAYDWPRVYTHLPIGDIDQAASHRNEGFRALLAHPRAGDPFWKGVSFENDVRKIPVPTLVVDGWYDIFLAGALRDDIKLRTEGATELARKGKRIVIGPWSHMTGGRDNNPGLPATGPDRSIDFGPNAVVNTRNLYLRWNDHWLKGIDNGVDRDPPVSIFVMGENVWRFENEWPLARTRYTKYYFSSNGKANGANGDGVLSPAQPAGAGADRFTYDPLSPVPTIGGNLLDCLGCNSVKSGPLNQAAVEARDDVLVYTTPVLTEPVEVTGPLTVKLYAATDGRDTDWTAKLVDVHPDGYAQNIQDGIVRARYRAGVSAPASLLEPNAVYEYAIDLWATSNVFLPGHRIRVEISSGNFPRFDRNLNTGDDPVTGTRVRTAHQTVYHDATHPSHIVLPIIPRASGK